MLLILGKKFAILARKYNAITLIDFLKVRYSNSKAVVLLAAASIIIFLFSAMTAQWVGGGRLIESLTGMKYTTALFIFAVSVLSLRSYWWFPSSGSDGCCARRGYGNWDAHPTNRSHYRGWRSTEYYAGPFERKSKSSDAIRQ